MTVRYNYLPQAEVMLMVYEGRSTATQQDRLFKEMAAVFGVGPFTNSISDMSALTSTTITSSDMFAQSSAVKAQVERLAKPIKQALYAPHALPYGIARMYMGYADLSSKLDIQIFDDLQAAINWLELQGTAETLFDSQNWRSIAD